MDIVHTVLKWLDYNRYKVIALLVIASVMVWGLGCQSETASLTDPGQKVPYSVFTAQAAQEAAKLQGERAQLMAQVEAFNAQAEALQARITAGAEDLANQEKIKADLFNMAAGVITQAAGGEPITAAGIIGTGLAALALVGGFGALADGSRKDKLLEETKARLTTIEKLKT